MSASSNLPQQQGPVNGDVLLVLEVVQNRAIFRIPQLLKRAALGESVPVCLFAPRKPPEQSLI